MAAPAECHRTQGIWLRQGLEYLAPIIALLLTPYIWKVKIIPYYSPTSLLEDGMRSWNTIITHSSNNKKESIMSDVYWLLTIHHFHWVLPEPNEEIKKVRSLTKETGYLSRCFSRDLMLTALDLDTLSIADPQYTWFPSLPSFEFHSMGLPRFRVHLTLVEISSVLTGLEWVYKIFF